MILVQSSVWTLSRQLRKVQVITHPTPNVIALVKQKTALIKQALTDKHLACPLVTTLNFS